MTLTAAEVGEALRTHLMGDGLYVTDCERHEGALHVGYESMTVGDGVPSGEVGAVLRLLLDLAGIETAGRDVAGIAEAGAWDPGDVHVWVFEDPGDGAERREPGEGDVEASGEGNVEESEEGDVEERRASPDADGERGADGTVGGDDRVRKGHYEVREGWFHALREGYLSETDFSTLVLSTLE